MKFKVTKGKIQKSMLSFGDVIKVTDEIELEGEPTCWKDVPYTVVHGPTDGNLCLNCGLEFKITSGCLQIEKKKEKPKKIDCRNWRQF